MCMCTCSMYLYICACPFVPSCPLGYCQRGYLRPQAQLYASSPRIPSLSVLLLSILYLSPTLNRGGGKGALRHCERA